jgi:hypothetical protein
MSYPETYHQEYNKVYMQNHAHKFDERKLDYSLVPWQAVEEVVRVLEFGKTKYNEPGYGPETWNWTKGSGLNRWRVLNAVFRHVTAYARGEELDPESGLSHLAHACCGLWFLIYYSKHPEQFNDVQKT